MGIPVIAQRKSKIFPRQNGLPVPLSKLKKVYEITSFNEDAAMRPWLARAGDQLLISFDAYTKHMVVEVKLDLSAFGVDPEAVDTGVRPQDWDFEEQAIKEHRGCQFIRTPQSIFSVLILGMGLMSLRRRQF